MLVSNILLSFNTSSASENSISWFGSYGIGAFGLSGSSGSPSSPQSHFTHAVHVGLPSTYIHSFGYSGSLIPKRRVRIRMSHCLSPDGSGLHLMQFQQYFSWNISPSVPLLGLYFFMIYLLTPSYVRAGRLVSGAAP